MIQLGHPKLTLIASFAMASLPAIGKIKVIRPYAPAESAENVREKWLDSKIPGIDKIALIPDPEVIEGKIKYSKKSTDLFKSKLRDHLGEVTIKQFYDVLYYLDPRLCESAKSKIEKELNNPNSKYKFTIGMVVTEELFNFMLSGIEDLNATKHKINLSPRKQTGDQFLVVSPEKRLVMGDFTEQLQSYALWYSQVDTLRACGAEVLVVNGSQTSGTGQELWVKDLAYTNLASGVIYSYSGSKPLESNLSRDRVNSIFHKPPIADIKSTRSILENLGFTVQEANSLHVEFGQVIFDPNKNILFIGTDHDAALVDYQKRCELLKKELGHNNSTVIALSLSQTPEGTKYSDWFYHLDCCLAVLPPTKVNSKPCVLIAKDGLTDDSIAKVTEKYGKDNIIEISKDAGLKLATNVRVIGSQVISPFMPQQAISKLEARGYQVITPAILEIEGGFIGNTANDSPWKISNAGISCASLQLPKLKFPTNH